MPHGKDISTIHIVTPCLHGTELLNATIESVMAQQGNFHLRYHVQDGISSRETVALLQRWEKAAQSYTVAPRCCSFVFTWASAPCNNLYEVIVQGFARLDIGPDDFVTWLNSADILLPNAVERVARVALARPDVLWLAGVTHTVDPTGATVEYAPLNQCPQDIIAAGLCDKRHWDPVHQVGSFWRNSLYVEVGGFDLSFSSAGDWDLWRRFAQLAPRYVLPVSLGATRVRSGQVVVNSEMWRREIDNALPLPRRTEASLHLIVPKASYLSPQLPDPLIALTLEGDDGARAENWRQRVCPDTPWPRITIVTPSFNQGLFLDACMRSILDQKYPNLEYIVMDGGSTDNSVSVIRGHSSRLAYWQSKPDGGQYQAITDGLNRGTGDIMAWLNADDLYVGPCLFKVAMQFMVNSDTRWIAARNAVCDQMSRIGPHRDLLWSRAGLLDVSCTLKDQFLGQDAVFWRRDLWVEAGSKLDKDLSLAADFDLWVRFFRITPVRIVQDLFSAYRHHGDQRSLSSKHEYLKQMCDVVDRELRELSPHRLSVDFFTPAAPQSMAYADVLAPVAGMPLPDSPPLESPGQGVYSLDDLVHGLARTRRVLTSISSYHEAIHLDDMALHVQVADHIQGVRCVSFDCFDTVLYRLCDEPTRLFLEVGRRLQKSGNIKSACTPEQFKSLRIAAENKARRQALETRRTAECSIEEIYMQLHAVVPDIMQGVKTEILTEQDFCHPNPAMLGLMRHYRTQGYKIAILSDNYLSSKQLASILEHSGVCLSEVDLVLTSRDAKVAKYESKLYAVAAAKLGIAPHEILHIGDSELADVKAAHAAGVIGVHYTRYPGMSRRVLQREKMLHHLGRHAASLSSFRVLAHRLGGQVRPEWRGYYQDGAFLFGPALARYADWVVQQCRQEGITCCLVFMREAQTLMPLIKRSAAAAGFKLEVRPFYVSRHSVSMASMFEVTPKSVFEKTVKHRKCSPRLLLKALGLPEDKLTGLDPALLDTPLNDAERFSFSRIVALNPIYSRLLGVRAREARQAFVYYALSQFGGHERLAVADIGFRGTIQLSMDRILRHEGVGVHLTGLYFCTQVAAADVVLEGSDLRSFLGHLGAWQQETQTLYTHPEILEQAVNAVCGTTLGYSKQDSGVYQPDIEEVSMPFDQLYKRWLLQLGIMSFQKIWLDYAGPRFLNAHSLRQLDSKCLEEIDTEVMYIMQRLFCFPTADEAGRLGSLYHDDNDGTDLGGLICDASARERFRQGGLERLFSDMVYWPHGVIAIEAPEIFDQMFIVKARFEQP